MEEDDRNITVSVVKMEIYFDKAHSLSLSEVMSM